MKLRGISTYFAEPSLQECESSKSWQNLDRKVKVEMENDECIKTPSKSDSLTNSNRQKS